MSEVKEALVRFLEHLSCQQGAVSIIDSRTGASVAFGYRPNERWQMSVGKCTFQFEREDYLHYLNSCKDGYNLHSVENLLDNRQCSLFLIFGNGGHLYYEDILSVMDNNLLRAYNAEIKRRLREYVEQRTQRNNKQAQQREQNKIDSMNKRANCI